MQTLSLPSILEFAGWGLYFMALAVICVIAYPLSSKFRAEIHQIFVSFATVNNYMGRGFIGTHAEFETVSGQVVQGTIVACSPAGNWRRIQTRDGKEHVVELADRQPIFSIRYVEVAGS